MTANLPNCTCCGNDDFERKDQKMRQYKATGNIYCCDDCRKTYTKILQAERYQEIVYPDISCSKCGVMFSPTKSQHYNGRGMCEECRPKVTRRPVEYRKKEKRDVKPKAVVDWTPFQGAHPNSALFCPFQ